MSQMKMFEAAIQVEAGLELREMVRPLLVQVARRLGSLRSKAMAAQAVKPDASFARGTMETRIARAQEG